MLTITIITFFSPGSTKELEWLWRQEKMGDTGKYWDCIDLEKIQ